ncbi:MAG: hypothetical protein ACYC21_11720, partial [Eubacteriales bacterium]
DTLYEYDAAMRLTKMTTTNSPGTLTMSYNGQTYYYVFNGHGDVVALTDANGVKVASYRYDPWDRR